MTISLEITFHDINKIREILKEFKLYLMEILFKT